MRLNVKQVPQNKIIVYEVRLKGVQTIEFCCQHHGEKGGCDDGEGRGKEK